MAYLLAKLYSRVAYLLAKLYIWGGLSVGQVVYLGWPICWPSCIFMVPTGPYFREKCLFWNIDVELFGNPGDPLTNHRWRVVWRHLVPAKIPRASFIKFYYVVTESQSADTWCHVVVVRNLIGPHSRRYTWRTVCKTSSIFVEIRQHTCVYVSCILKQSDKMNKQKHIVDVKKYSLVSRFITTCLSVADRRGDQSFPGHGLRPKIFVWIRLKLKITHFINLTGHPKCQIAEIS